MNQSKTKFIVYYFPQFHSIKENDEWWGKDFTDWIYVRNAKPLFKGHEQPRKPLNNNYYDLTNPEVIKWQVDIAKEYGVYGFCFHHYWFDGKLLLEKPLEIFLQNRDFNIPFCISWANESWTKRWIGKNNVILQEQKHTPDPILWENHFNYLLPFLKDNRYIKCDNKPIFIIYQPDLIKNTHEMFELWDNLAQRNGLKGIHYIATRHHTMITRSVINNYDGFIKFQPREAYNSKSFRNKSIFSKFQILRYLPLQVRNWLTDLKQKIMNYELISADEIWEAILTNVSQKPIADHLRTYEGAFMEWDNTPRYAKKSKIFYGATPQKFKRWLKELIRLLPEKNTFVFINAWNEWSETAYLEPDEKLGYSYLEALKEVHDSNV